MTTPTQPTAGTGNATTNISGRESKGSQYTDKSQTAGDLSVSAALQPTVPGTVDVVASFEPGPAGRAAVEVVMRNSGDVSAPAVSAMFTPGRARAVAAQLTAFADSADEVNGAPSIAEVDLDAWAAGEDADADEMVREELEAARLTFGYDFEGDDVDLVEWEPGEEVDYDDLVAEELHAFRVLNREPVDVVAWQPGTDAVVDVRLREELEALRLSAGASGRIRLAEWVAGASEAADTVVSNEVVALRRQRRRNRNASI